MFLENKRAESLLTDIAFIFAIAAAAIIIVVCAPLAAVVGCYEERLRKQRDRGDAA